MVKKNHKVQNQLFMVVKIKEQQRTLKVTTEQPKSSRTREERTALQKLKIQQRLQLDDRVASLNSWSYHV